MEAPVFEKGYPSYEAVNRKCDMSQEEMVIYLHDLAREKNDNSLRYIADTLSDYIKSARRHNVEIYI